MDLFADLRRTIMEVIPIRDPQVRSTFAKLDTDEQTLRFLNWQSRLVHPHPRRIFRAEGFEAAPAFQENRADVNRILAKLAAGLDVMPNLSRGIQDGYVLHPPERKHGADFDLLLNEWGIHHLHLSSVPDSRKTGFTMRGDDVLFAIIGPGTVHAIGVGHHRDWTAPYLVETAVRSWPQDRFFLDLGVMPEQTWRPDEHQQLRNAGVSAATPIDGRLHISRLTLGLTTALVSTAISREAGRVLRVIHAATNDRSNVLDDLWSEAGKSLAPWPRRPRLRVVRASAPTRWAFGFQEETSGASLAI